MSLTAKEKQRIYDEELERSLARKKIRAKVKNTKKSPQLIDWIIIIGVLFMLFIAFGGGK
ncbi:MAG TPA: hypothetical protein PKA28_03730 [Methylomusa anaerophila]|uniref:Uncharacterized protein n=1 Tax=Methylomusa anaerophila TaxID=1930071 RepID=A0A348ANG0_9FIRM|nr:hypothetical protein [Methylomusa anaerophila]BBB92608.1 hypothetical protein MAMMFC1_03303 [Methylomusa anaerophila]HML87538.1 hypothetical protein [Methylomusa anaerophila]